MVIVKQIQTLNNLEDEVAKSKIKAKEILESAEKEAVSKGKEIELKAKERAYSLKEEAEKEIRNSKNEILQKEARLAKKEETLDHKIEKLENKSQELEKTTEELEQKREEIEKFIETLGALSPAFILYISTKITSPTLISPMVSLKSKNPFFPFLSSTKKQCSATTFFTTLTL